MMDFVMTSKLSENFLDLLEDWVLVLWRSLVEIYSLSFFLQQKLSSRAYSIFKFKKKKFAIKVCSLCVCLSLSHVQLFATPWTVDHQAPLSKEFPWQEYWSGLPFPYPGDLDNPDSLPSEPPGNTKTCYPCILLECHR